MVSNCGICGQFTGQTAEKTVRFRGLDKRDGIERVETDVSDVFIGECCGLDVIESDDTNRNDRSYQRYLNGTDDGEFRYVMLVQQSVPPTEIEVVKSMGVFGGKTENVEVDGKAERPILGSRLPEAVKEYIIGKMG